MSSPAVQNVNALKKTQASVISSDALQVNGTWMRCRVLLFQVSPHTYTHIQLFAVSSDVVGGDTEVQLSSASTHDGQGSWLNAAAITLKSLLGSGFLSMPYALSQSVSLDRGETKH